MVVSEEEDIEKKKKKKVPDSLRRAEDFLC